MEWKETRKHGSILSMEITKGPGSNLPALWFATVGQPLLGSLRRAFDSPMLLWNQSCVDEAE